MTVIEVKVYFDNICAWCYIGHRTLFQAIALFQKTYPGASSDNFRVSFSPFYRDRTLPDEAVPLESRLVSSLGEDKLGDVKTRVDRIGRANGIRINLQSLIGSTRSSQRLVLHAARVGGLSTQKDLIEQIYFRWFEIGGDITSHTFLLECAEAAGLDASEAANVLKTGKYGSEVDELDVHARNDGIACVPTFIVHGIKIEGAEDAATFYEAFVKTKEKEASDVPAPTT
ncbi:hypothetical protein M409DRAFT_19993 [Zasmidium cellare ATCC 36951]|uniref:DSBA-like thioredoxin domain-containing protein n=1 Tax=Zasmidium cellare ATCC 36951 TaxID=1080233 RepID=A0A6A6CR79_ZASCE|nr:uncharacterized protein M409DRAFT_19993 [Zasmidium cellare ATCC 36951]KAF2169581.1 hypothetical protein M409DRAFT_19993 [Zasmidium cellare ATCC 36951]